MAAGRRTRWHRTIAAVVVVVSVGAAAWWVGSRPNDVHLALFERPGSWCDWYEDETILASVEAVARTEGPGLRADMSIVQAGLLRKTARDAGTPTARAADLEALADELEQGTDTGSFGPALRRANELDEHAAAACA